MSFAEKKISCHTYNTHTLTGFVRRRAKRRSECTRASDALAALTDATCLSRAARAARKHRLTSGPTHSGAETRFVNEKASIVLQVDDSLHRVGAIAAKNGHRDQWQIVRATLWARSAFQADRFESGNFVRSRYTPVSGLQVSQLAMQGVEQNGFSLSKDRQLAL